MPEFLTPSLVETFTLAHSNTLKRLAKFFDFAKKLRVPIVNDYTIAKTPCLLQRLGEHGTFELFDRTSSRKRKMYRNLFI